MPDENIEVFFADRKGGRDTSRSVSGAVSHGILFTITKSPEIFVSNVIRRLSRR